MTDDVVGPAFQANSDMAWALFVAKKAYEDALIWGNEFKAVDHALMQAGYATIEPFDLEETCERYHVVTVVDVGEEYLIPIAIYSDRTEHDKRIWWWGHVSPERRKQI